MCPLEFTLCALLIHKTATATTTIIITSITHCEMLTVLHSTNSVYVPNNQWVLNRSIRRTQYKYAAVLVYAPISNNNRRWRQTTEKNNDLSKKANFFTIICPICVSFLICSILSFPLEKSIHSKVSVFKRLYGVNPRSVHSIYVCNFNCDNWPKK